MRLKRYIALLTAAIYCFAIVAPAHASVTCECVTRGAAAAHACCTHCLGGDCSPEGVHIAAPCCDDRHSTEIALYTFASEEDDAPVRAARIGLRTDCTGRPGRARRRVFNR